MSELVVESRPDAHRRSVPVRFGRAGGRFEEVESVLDWWPGEGHRYFRVRVRYGGEPDDLLAAEARSALAKLSRLPRRPRT